MTERVRLKRSLWHQTLRVAFFVGALLMSFIGSEVFSPPDLIIPTKSEARKHSRSELSAADRLRNSQAAVRNTLLNLPVSFEPGDGANQFLARGGGYRLLITSA